MFVSKGGCRVRQVCVIRWVQVPSSLCLKVGAGATKFVSKGGCILHSATLSHDTLIASLISDWRALNFDSPGTSDQPNQVMIMHRL